MYKHIYIYICKLQDKVGLRPSNGVDTGICGLKYVAIYHVEVYWRYMSNTTAVLGIRDSNNGNYGGPHSSLGIVMGYA